MPSTYSPDLRIELIANGEQSGTWGTTTNNNLGTLIEDAIAGLASVSVISANQALTALNGVADQARCAALRLTTTTLANFSVYAPPVTKIYIIQNASAYSATIYASTVLGNTTAAGAGVTIPAGKTVLVRSNGTDFVGGIDYIPGSFGVDGDATFGTRLSGTYTQTATTVTVTTPSAHGYVNGESVAFINSTGLGVSGTYTITFINTTSFSFTSPVSQATSGNCFVTNDFITANGVFDPGVVIEGSSTIPALRVTQTGGGVALRVDDANSPDSSPFIVDTSGRVLVGVDSTLPSGLLYPLEISSTSTSGIGVGRFSADSSSAVIAFGKSRNTTNGDLGDVVANGDNLGMVTFFGDDGDAFIEAAEILAEVDGTPGNNDMPGRLVFSTTADGASSSTERLRINNAGNIIIGSGEASATTTGNTLRAPNRTGTDVAGADLIIAAGNGTGTGGSGYITLQTAVPGTTSSTANTMVDRLKIAENGFLTGQYSTMGAGVVPSESFYMLASDYAGANVNTAQALFGVGINLAANTAYAFEMVFVLFKASGGLTHTVSLQHDIGSGTLPVINYMVIGIFDGSVPAAVSAPDTMQYIQTTAATAVTATSGTGAGVNFRSVVRGVLTVGTAGKWTPQYKLSVAPGSAYTTLAGGYVRVYPIGPSGAAINVGGWS